MHTGIIRAPPEVPWTTHQVVGVRVRELHKYRFKPHGGNEEKATLLTLNGTNYWGKTGLTVQKPTLIISNHNYH